MSTKQVKYHKLEDGEAQRLNLDEQDWCIACCDCGAVHLIQFHHIKDNIWDFAAFRQPRRTAQLRRHQYGALSIKNFTARDKYVITRKF